MAKRRIYSNRKSGSSTPKAKPRQIYSKSRKGGIAEGAKYAGASLAAGLGTVGEGITDIAAAGSALMGGHTERAKSYFLENKVSDWREGVREELNPGGVGEFIGDAAQGVGQSSVFLLDAAVPGLGTGLFFAGIGSQGVSSAAAKTGDVGAREVIYGALSGGLEAATEKVIGAGGQAAGKLAGSAARKITGKAATEATKRAGKSLTRTMITDVLKSMAGEAAEEGASELLDPVLQKVTGVDKNASTSFGDVLYSMGVGALSGGLMSAPTTVASHKANERRGAEITARGDIERILNTARATQETATAAATFARDNKARMDAEREAAKAAKAAKTADTASTTAGDPTQAKDKNGAQGGSAGAMGATGTVGTAFESLGARIKDANTRHKWNRQVKRTEAFAEAIGKNLKVWDAMDDAQRQSSAGMDLLGEIATNLSFHEINGVLDEEAEIILEMSDEELAPIVEAVNAMAKERGKDASYTVEDVRADRDGILYQMAARRAMEEFEINEAETAKAAKTAKTETDEKAAKTADTAVGEAAGETEKTAAEKRREAPAAGFAYRDKSNDPERFLQVADAAGMEKNSEIRALAFDEYLAHHRDMDVRHFIDAYKLELAAGKYGIREEFPETARLNPETRKNARLAGEILRRDEDARARRKADGKDAKKASEKPVQKAAPKPAYNRNRVHLEDGLKAYDLKGDRRAVLEAAGIMANVMGNEIYIYDSRAHKGVEMPNGFIDAKGNLHIDIHAGTGGRELGLLALAHESVHFIKDYDPEGFREIGDKVVSLAEGAGVDVMALVRRKLDALEARGRTEGMSPSAAMDLAYEEVIADSMESVLQDGRAVEEMVELNPTLFESLIRHIKEIVAKIKKALAGLRPESEAGRMLSEIAGAMDEVREMYVVALTHAGEARRDASSMNSEKMHDADSQTNGDVRESFAGRNAHTADHMKLATAERMIAEGVDSETVRKETGWFKGYDGEWRFEIADPININATEMYENRFTTLGKLIYHPDLFSAYPDLADMQVTFEEMEAKGAYHRDFDTISLNDDFRKPFGAGGISETLTHEIQHAVQAREGFAHGASPNYWDRKSNQEQMVENACRKKQNIFDQAPDEFRQMVRKINRAVLDYDDVLVSDLLDEIYDSPYAELYKQYDMADFEYRAIKEKVDRGDFDPIELYYRTAGEVEARDSARRLGLSSGQRKNTRPDIDRTDVVFAEESSAEWHSGKNKKYDPETASIATQIRLHQDELNQMDIVASAKTPETFNRSYDAVQWAIEELQSTGYQVDRQGFGKVYFNPKDINKGANYANTNEERAAFAVLPKVIKRGIIIGDHNQHKQRAKNTITFAAPVELNGKRGNVGVVVNLNGNHYYAHRILLPDGSSFVFSDTKNEARQEPQRGVTETGSLANATSLASVNSIPQTAPDVNPTGENNSENGNRYSDRPDAFTDALEKSGIGTDRYLLATALESAVANEREYSLLKRYKENLGKLESLSSELDSVNEELKRLTFAKGRDGAAVKSLQERKQGLVDKISKQDKRLLSLEAAKPLCDILERERRKARSEGRKEAEDKSRERRQSTDALNRRRVIVDIADRWLTLLEKPTKNRNIPKVMEPLVLDILSTINFDPADAEKLTNDIAAKIAEETAKESPDIDRIEKWKKAIDRIGEVRKNNADFAARVASLYRKAKVSKDADVQSAYDPAVEAKIDEISEMIGEKSLDELTFEELQEVRRTVAMVSHAITERKELFVSSSKQTVAEASEAIQGELSPIIDKRGKRKPIPGTDGRTPTFIKFWKGAYINELKPVYFFDEIESATLRRMFGDLYTKGERTFARDLLEIRAFREKVVKEFKVKSWDRESRKEFETESGKVRLNLGQIMAIYADSKREQAVGHLLTGGFCLDPNEAEPVKIKGKIKTPIKTSIDDAKTYRLTEEQMWKIVGALTDEQREYVDTMVRFLSSDMARKGNEVSMKLYGVELFNEVFYFPIQTKSAYRAAASTQQKGDPMLKSMGMTKPTVPEAKNPLVLSDFDAVWGKHCADMTSYHALVLPIEDLRRVFEYGSTDAEVGASSTKGAIINAYGEAAERYISTLLTDLNGGLRQDPTGSFTSKMISLMKKSRVMASLSVAVQQPLAAVRAMAMIDPKYFKSGASLKAGDKFTKQWELMVQYADTAVIKDIGFFDVGMGRRTADWINATVYEGAKEKGKAILTDSDYRDEWLGWLPSTADKWAWMAIWGAVENEVAATNGELTRGSEEFYRAVGERFDEVVRRTQVYDSLLSRSAFMRSKHAVMQMATAFMAEPTTTVNMMVAGIRQMAKGDKRAGARTLGMVYAAMLLTAVASSLVYAMRDDDEDETYGEKYVESLSEQVRPWTMFPNMIPFVRDAVSLMEGYDIQRTDMTIVADAVNAFNVVMSDKKDGYQKTEAAAGAIGTLFGIPVRNVMRDLRAVANSLQNEAAGEASDLGYAFRKGFLGASASNGQRLYDLRLSGDKAQYARVAARYETEAKATAALRKALRDNDPRVAEAAEARLAGKTAEAIRIRGEIVAEGHFSDEEVLGAINAEVSAIKRLNAKEEEEA